jgi:hypothetical protein
MIVFGNESRGRGGRVESATRYFVGATLLVASHLLACGSDGVSYSRDVAPLLAQRCVPCHNSQAKGGRRDLEDPFTLDADSPGMFVATNDWDDEGTAHAGQSLPYNVVPFHPEESFLIEKITNRNLLGENYDSAACVALATASTDPLPPECAPLNEGSFMPEQQSLSTDSLDAIRTWIMNGADEGVYQATILPLLVSPIQYLATPCGTCHVTGGPETPDFTNAFDPVVGIVNVDAHFRSDMKLVKPGAPDESFLMLKLQATTGTSEIGSPMPRNFEPFSDEQTALIARWIAEGAKRN